MGAILGIDLGTSHASLAVWQADQTAALLPIPQYLEANSLGSPTLLPSVLAFPQPGLSSDLPWQAAAPLIGQWARELAISSPDRAVLSSKSWLCYRGDVKLPQGSPASEAITAREAASQILNHLVSAWENSTGARRSDLSQIAITVPASFHPLARQLTEEAAQAVGLKNILLLEEPLAAFYAWLGRTPDWNKILKTGDQILVCDVGGGTSDFSLIQVGEDAKGELSLERIAVGRHLLLGGDNMDLAIAHALAAKHGGLDHWQFVSLQQSVRKAKESLLKDDGPSVYPIAVASRGSSLFANTVSLELTRDELQSLLVEGFFPLVKADAEPQRARGLQMGGGLPYEADAAITRQLAAFLRQAGRNTQQIGLLQPTHILFNGGVFKADVLQKRVLENLTDWFGTETAVLSEPDLDHAVTLGATLYAGWKAEGNRLRVRTAASRSYFIGLEANEMAVPGVAPRIQGLCVLPLGVEEGSHLALNEQDFALWSGDDVEFRLYASEERAQLGDVVANAEQSLEPVSTLVSRIEGTDEGPVSVYLSSDYDETGKLQIAMLERSGSRRWDLNFQLREDA